MRWTLIAAVAMAASALAVEGMRRLALRHGVMDIPNARSSHHTPTPRGGGLAIVAVSMVAWAAGWGGGVRGLALPALLIAVVSWIDDVRTLSTAPRFATHFGCAGLVLALVGFWQSVELPLIGVIPLGPLGAVVALVWIVGLTNAYNFMDGIDGLAGAQAVVAGAAWFASGLMLGLPSVAVSGLVLASASAGFLIHNWSPARIFMGDVGSAFLGFCFGALGVTSAVTAEEGGSRVPLAALLFVWPFVFDATFTFLRRLRAGEDVFAAHRSHIYQRLVVAGKSHRFVSVLYAALAAVCATGGYLWLTQASPWIASCTLVVPPVLLLPLVRFAEGKAKSTGQVPRD